MRTPWKPMPSGVAATDDNEPDDEDAESDVVPPPSRLERSLASTSTLVGGLAVGLDLVGVLMEQSERGTCDQGLPAFVAGAENAVRRLVTAFGADQVHIISNRRRQMFLVCRTEFCQLSGLNPANIHFCGTGNMWPLLEQHKITFFVANRRDVALAIDEEVHRRAGEVPFPLGAYTGPTTLLMVPREMEPMEHYRRVIQQRRRGCLQLSNLEEAVDEILVHEHMNQC